jgi:hypothetical protein
LIDEARVDEARRVGRGGFRGVFLDRFESRFDGVDLGPVILIEPALELIVRIFRLISRAPKEFS